MQDCVVTKSQYLFYAIKISSVFEQTTHYELRIRNQLYSLEEPKIMGILNVTPDSFFDGGKHNVGDNLFVRIDQIIGEGADILDLGGQSTRPGAQKLSEEEEWNRIKPAVEYLYKHYPQTIISIDTFYSSVFERAFEKGASIINDISAGVFDERLPLLAEKFQVPYVLMHMQGVPGNMQVNPVYGDVVAEVLSFLDIKRSQLIEKGVKDILIDPGFGFGKSLEHNLALLKHLHLFSRLDSPLMVGLSNKSFLKRVAGDGEVLGSGVNAAAHMQCLLSGAMILRVHDVAEAVRVRELWKAFAI
jgi:dihydropteroate synthase